VLRISEVLLLKGERSRPQPRRSQIHFPASGLDELSSYVNEIVQGFCPEKIEQEREIALVEPVPKGKQIALVEPVPKGKQIALVDPVPKGKQLRVGSKTYYFDVAENQRGQFMRVSEVSYRYYCS